ncbi:MAG: sugar transferase [Tannerella sp.]|jgi:lipopolysaccharide/colanic/teichoic acid biosynthesis glycosyltransferase|nr:sugar transferase [Tannerella sp.]
MYKRYFKRIMDLFFSIPAFIVLSPVFILITFLLFISNKGQPFFFQKRPGINNKIFTIIKYKTMNDREDENGELLPDSERMTTVGSFIRKSSLDEMPQLINVIKGDMSLVGPRPLLPEYLSRYSAFQIRRHEVRPGITGWAQVNGRNAVSWNQKFEYDVWYVDNISLSLDIKIIFMTILAVFKSQGINSATSVTMERFKG